VIDETAKRLARRATFDTAAERYDRVRPRYPAALFDEWASLAGLRAGSRVLEVGCGTGQATRDLADRGFRVTALELGAELAAVAARRLADRPNVQVIRADFESWPLPPEPFDAVLFATSFHWLDPTTRASRAASAVRPGGAVATIRTHHVAGGTEAFFAEAQDCYLRWDPDTEPGIRLAPAAEIPVDSEGLDAADALDPLELRRHEWEETYTREAYLELLLTYSGHIALDPDSRAGLLDCIGRLIDERYGGSIAKRYLFELFVARVR
jgi:SAM-dependent methyltransferase